MRSLVCFFAIALFNAAIAQDPTVPSPQILERLGNGPSKSVATSTTELIQERAAPPVVKLKAVVMTDSDQGTAMIEVDGRRLLLRLSRTAAAQTAAQTAAPESSSQPTTDGVVIQGSTYYVRSFSARSVVLSNDSQTLTAQ